MLVATRHQSRMRLSRTAYLPMLVNVGGRSRGLTFGRSRMTPDTVRSPHPETVQITSASEHVPDFRFPQRSSG